MFILHALCLQIMNMEKGLVEGKRGEVITSQSHTSQARHTQKATRTLENKLDRVNRESVVSQHAVLLTTQLWALYM